MARLDNAFINLTGTIKPANRPAVHGSTVGQDEIQEPERLAQVLTELMKRVRSLEGVQASNYTEFEVSLPASGTVQIAHNFGCPVRYWVTSWKSAGVVSVSMNESESTENVLVINSTVAGRATVRVEKATEPLTSGST